MTHSLKHFTVEMTCHLIFFFFFFLRVPNERIRVLIWWAFTERQRVTVYQKLVTRCKQNKPKPAEMKHQREWNLSLPDLPTPRDPRTSTLSREPFRFVIFARSARPSRRNFACNRWARCETRFWILTPLSYTSSPLSILSFLEPSQKNGRRWI